MVNAKDNIPTLIRKKVKVKPTRIYRAATGKWEDITWWWYVKNIHYPNMIKKIKQTIGIKYKDTN